MSFLFNELLFRPIFNVLVSLYNIIPGSDFGVAILVLTFFIRLLFFPLTVKSLVAQKELARLQPELKKLQDKYKNDKQQLGAATMALYKEHKINPLSGCLPLLVQLPVLFALFKALGVAFNPDSLSLIYGFITKPEVINNISFKFINLEIANRPMAILAGVLQWFQAKITQKNQGHDQKGQQSQMALMSKQMLYFFPIMVIIISWNFPAGVVLYWVATNALSIAEQFIVGRKTA
ncbi:MAG: YidC/Oxa1 family membrane protein insertase [bacterium]|nr:YidC/Oxa1 family membrane protein insertase [bacterium]